MKDSLFLNNNLNSLSNLFLTYDIMPPKKAKQGATIIDGVDMKEMTRDKLEQFTIRVKEELDREREERNYYQVERDKIRTFWEITRTQHIETKADVRIKEREADEIREKIEDESREHERHIKQLLWEQSVERAALRGESQAAVKAEQAAHEAQRRRLMADCRELKAKLVEAERASTEHIRLVKMEHQKEISQIRTEFEERLKEIDTTSEKRLERIINEMTLDKRTALVEVEERKNKQINNLIKSHEKAFSDLKNYYNDITLNNLALISGLKSQMEEIQKAKERAEKTAADALTEGRKLADPLKVALAEAAELKRKEHYYQRDKESLAGKTRILATLSKQYEAIKWEYDVLEQKYEKVAQERDELRSRFSKAILDLHQRAALKGALLEQKLLELNNKVDEKNQSSDSINFM